MSILVKIISYSGWSGTQTLYHHCLDHVIWKAKKNNKLNGAHQFLVYADDVNFCGKTLVPQRDTEKL
jgi:hypothetical protein